MAKNKIYSATVKATGEKIEVYVLRQPYPSKDYVWCNYKDCKTVYTNTELNVSI